MDDLYIKKLNNGETVQFRPHGRSMEPRIKSGQLVTVRPRSEGAPKKDDIVFCRVNGRLFVHLVKQTKDGKYLIGNNREEINGWTDLVYGIISKIEN